MAKPKDSTIFAGLQGSKQFGIRNPQGIEAPQSFLPPIPELPEVEGGVRTEEDPRTFIEKLLAGRNMSTPAPMPKAPASIEDSGLEDDLREQLDQKASESFNMSSTMPASLPGNSQITAAPESNLIGADYTEALKKAEQGRLVENLLGNFERINRSISGAGTIDTTPVANKGIADLYSGDKRILDASAERQETENKLQETDPKSSISQIYRDSIKEVANLGGLNINIPDSLSAARVRELFPQLASVVDRKQRREEIGLSRQAQAIAREDVKKTKLDNEANKWVTSQARANEKVISYKQDLQQAYDQLSNIQPGSRTAADDISLLYKYIKALDKDSAVREGELGLAQQAKGLRGSISTKISQLQKNPRLLDNKTYNDLMASFKSLKDSADAGYNNRMRALEKQAEKRSIPLDYLQGIDPDYVPSSMQVAAPKEEAAPSPRVKVMSPEGKTGSIPREQLPAALKKGFTEVK